MPQLVSRSKFALPLARLLHARSVEEAAAIAGMKVSRLREIKKQRKISEATYKRLVVAALRAQELDAEARAKASERTEYPPLTYDERQRLRALVAEKQRARYHRERMLGINR